MAINNFGGNWTETKLNIFEKYLNAYIKILKKYNNYYKIAYIDAFAGTGYIKNELSKDEENNLFEIEETKKFLEGSSIRALKAKPEFDKYFFVELDENKVNELKNIIYNEFPHLLNKVEIRSLDANKFLYDLCNKNWKNHRALVFLDPFGMEVKWNTIEAIAKTEAIDLWILFPLGVGVNRLLTNDISKMPLSWENKLNDIFGTNEWKNIFYKTNIEQSLFGEKEKVTKIANFELIATYYINRLKTIFAGVIDKPLYLYNSRNNPIFMYCFASANPKGSKTAIKIAKDIMIKEMGLK